MENTKKAARHTNPETNQLEPLLLYCTFPHAEEARTIAKKLLERRLIACANIFAPHESVYEWQGEIQVEQEVAVIFKTISAHYDDAEACIQSLHSYKTPCIVSLSLTQGSNQFLQWIQDQCKLDVLRSFADDER